MEIPVGNYKGAQIALIPESGRFKAEFGKWRKTVYADTLKGVKSMIEKAFDGRMLAAPMKVVYFHFDQPEVVELLGVMQKGEYGPTFVFRSGDGKTHIADTLDRWTPEFDAVIERYNNARAGLKEAMEIEEAARSSLYEAHERLRFSVNQLEDVLEEAA